MGVLDGLAMTVKNVGQDVMNGMRGDVKNFTKQYGQRILKSNMTEQQIKEMGVDGARKFINNKAKKQLGNEVFDKITNVQAKKVENNLLKKGVIVRHLMLPNMENDTKEILNYLYNTYKDNIYISLMNQYTPIKKLKYNELNNTLDEKIYENMIDYAYNLGIRNCFVQEQDSKGKCFIPDFTQKIES